LANEEAALMHDIITLILATAVLVAIPGPNVALIVALLNPKILLFNVAFLPQFVHTDGPVFSQLLLLSGIYLSVLFLGDLLWALLGASAKPWLSRYGRFSQRLSGSIFIAAGIGLALSRQRLNS
jgi:threonine/homoserine/homoserine lactone efflux protein